MQITGTSILLIAIVVWFLTSKDRVRTLKTKTKELFFPTYGLFLGNRYALSRLLFNVKTLLEENFVTYSITGKTLLEAIRRGKLPHSLSNVDLVMPKEYMTKLYNLGDQFKKYNLYMDDLPEGGIKISQPKMNFLSNVSVSIHPLIEVGDKWIANHRVLGLDEWYYQKDLFPSKLYKLGTFFVPGPQNPVEYLTRNFILPVTNSIPWNRKWYQLPPKIFATYPVIGSVDRVNGIVVDPRPIGNKKPVVLGNGKVAYVPQVGNVRRI